LNVTIAFSQLALHLIHFTSFMDHQPANPAVPIDAERLRAYVALIDKLLLGARENANALLNAERELVDEGLVEVMGRYAESLRQYGNQEAAAFLEDCGQQITAVLRQIAHQTRGVLSERQQAYLGLIQTLLNCKAGKVAEILNANNDQLDADFFQACEQVARWLDGQNKEQAASWLRGVAAPLEAIASARSGFSPSGAQGAFLIQLLQATACSQGDPKVVFPLLQDNLALLNIDLVALLNQWWQSALAREEHDLKQSLAAVLVILGTCLNKFPLGSPGTNHQIAISAYKNSLQVYTRNEHQQDHAMTNNNLGLAYRMLAPFSANPGGQIQDAIAAFNEALLIYTKAEHPQDWATTTNNLGNAYLELAPFSANPGEQIQEAIAALNDALLVNTKAEQPQDWAATKLTLGNAYLKLAPFSANPGEQIQEAIAAFNEALLIYTKEEHPQDWATTTNNLGNAYLELAPFSANPGEQIQEAIAALNDALLGNTKAERPQDWAATKNNLGNVYLGRALFSAHPGAQIQEAISAFKDALQVYTKAVQPEAWAAVTNNLGNAYSELVPFSASPGEQIQEAIAAYNNALRVRDPVQRPTDCLQTARNLGDLGFTNKLPEVAINGYLLAITAVENLRSAAIDPARKAEIVSQAIEVYANLVQVYVDQQHYDQALEVVDRSKARNLVELLSTKDLYPKGEIPPEVIQRLDELRGSIARAERELNRSQSANGLAGKTMAGSDGISGPEGARSLAFERIQQERAQTVGEHLLQLKQELDRLIQDQIQPIDPTFSLSQKVQPLSIEELQATLPDERTVLVSWYVAGSKLLAFILTRDARQPLCHRYPESTLELLTAELNSYFGTYQSDKNAWMAELPAALVRFSSLLELEALAEQISRFAPAADQLILVPHRFLHLLPLHCLPFGEASGSLQDQFARGVRFAPSLQVLQVVQQRQQTPLESLFALQNPTQDLLYSELEVEAIQSLFTAKKPAVLKRSEASKRALEEQSGSLASSTCLHFACHGYFNFEQPQLSALILAGSRINLAPEDSDANRHLPQPDGTALDLSQCLTLLDLFQLDLRQARLVALSACETGLSEINSLSDEFVGLSSGFLYAGCNSVIGTLWTVNDLSTGLLMGQFYRLLKQQEQTQQRTEVALALKQAQRWLRQLTCAEAVLTLQQQVPNLPEGIQETAKRSIRRALSERYAAEDRPYTNPFYWAAFCAVGQ
jgi:CHAT domain-containing protein